MYKKFEDAMKFVFKWEGGYVNDPNDPGGETKFGISKRAFPYIDIKNLDLETAKGLYKTSYWDKTGCDHLEPKLAVSVMDAAVNCGVGRVSKWLREDFNVKGLSLEEFNARREHYYRVEIRESLRSRYLKGWLNRLNDLRRYVQVM